MSVPVQKAEAVVAIGKRSLLLPTWTKAVLAASDYLRFFLSVVQTTVAHAVHPDLQMLDLAPEIGMAQSDTVWLHDMPATAVQVDSALRLPNLQRLTKWAAEELGVVARPVPETHDNAFREHVQNQLVWLGKIDVGKLTDTQLRVLISGVTAGGGDNLHQLTMDLHRQLTELERFLVIEEIDDAHIQQVLPEDRTRIAAFMYGLNRTTPPRFDHTGLRTAVTQDEDKPLLQNDISTTDIHVLVAQV